ncbi:MAG: PTS transporter subunit EIIA [Proteobacteria bacterium]|nr:PTS transporter subunit EIIA [Pseudomonadota bacterium]
MLLSYMSDELVVTEIKGKNKNDVIEELVDVFDKAGVLDNKKNFLSAIVKRENVETTAIGKGIAIPHGRSEDVKKMAILFARSKEGINFRSLDKKPVNIIFMIAAPLNVNKEYLQTIARIARLLRHEDIKEQLINAAGKEEILNIIKDFDGKYPVQGKVETKDGRVIHGK